MTLERRKLRDVTGETWTVQDCLDELEATADVEPANAPSGSSSGV